jgi:3-phosphoshikimate 1-carboxyvinyltransferase
LLPGGGQIASRLDHRIAMSMVVAGLAARAPITIDDVTPVSTSFPAFFDMLDTLTGDAVG